MFGDLDKDMIKDIADRLEWVHVARGQELFSEGDPSDSFFVIISGRLQMIITDQFGEDRVVGELHQGESVGEIGVFTEEPRSATIVALRDTELVRFSKTEVDELVQKYPQIQMQMMRLMISRLNRAQKQSDIAPQSVSVALVAAGDSPDTHEFVKRICEQVTTHDKCLYLSSEEVDKTLDTEGISNALPEDVDSLRLRTWLNEQDSKFSFIFYESDRTVTEWTKRCIRQADMVVFLGQAGADTSLNAVEKHVAEHNKAQRTAQRQWLVLLHKDGSKRPTGTARWFDGRAIEQHHHVRMDRDHDIARVARFVCGRAVGLCLSGGGARGFAHVGVIRRFEEEGIPVDMIGGVSMGALLSAAFAYSELEGFTEILNVIRGNLKGALNDYTVPLVAIASGVRFRRALEKFFGSIMIEDLWQPFFCVSSNLTRGETVTHRNGPLWEAVKASGSLPGVVTPIVQNGDMLYDGCLLNNLPMDVMREQVGRGIVVAVDVVPPVDFEGEIPEEVPSGWKLLWNKVTFRRTIEIPHIFAILQRAGQLSCIQNRQRLIDEGIADLYLMPPVGEFEILDFSTVDETARIGYEFAGEKVAEFSAAANT